MLKKTLAAAAAAAVIVGGLAGCNDDKSDKADATTAETSYVESMWPVTTIAPRTDESADLKKAIDINYGTTSWGQYISDVKVDKGNAHIRAQIEMSDKDTANKIQRGVVNLINMGDDFKDIDWVIIENGVGTVITQQQTHK